MYFYRPIPFCNRVKKATRFETALLERISEVIAGQKNKIIKQEKKMKNILLGIIATKLTNATQKLIIPGATLLGSWK